MKDDFVTVNAFVQEGFIKNIVIVYLFWRQKSKKSTLMELSAAWSAVEAATSALVSGSLGTESIARLKGAATSLLNDGFGSIAISYVLGAAFFFFKR